MVDNNFCCDIFDIVVILNLNLNLFIFKKNCLVWFGLVGFGMVWYGREYFFAFGFMFLSPLVTEIKDVTNK